ncbi:MAG: hypothetical protein R3F12_04965 [Lysobacteraceae bacterium]
MNKPSEEVLPAGFRAGDPGMLVMMALIGVVFTVSGVRLAMPAFRDREFYQSNPWLVGWLTHGIVGIVGEKWAWVVVALQGIFCALFGLAALVTAIVAFLTR